MLNAGIHWIVKSSEGDLKGPISTEDVIKLISSGQLLGNEKIRKYPDGRWIEVSRQPEFFDLLLNAIEDTRRDINKPAVIIKEPIIERNEETVIATRRPVVQSLIEDKAQSDSQQVATQITLTTHKPQSRKWLGYILFLSSALIVLIVFFMDNPVPEGKPNLIFPNLNKESNLSQLNIKDGLKRGIDNFLLDTYEGYQKSQETFVQTLEGANKNLELRGLLCLVYKELWPFVRQDAKDIETVQNLAKSTRQLDPLGINGIYCEITKLLVLGKYKEAKGYLENTMNQTQFSTAPVLYAFRSELLADENDFQTAVLYAEKAATLWPDWTQPKMQVARYLVKMNNFQKAHSIYENIIKLNPKNKAAQIELGILKYNAFRQSENATRLIAVALATNQKINRVLESKAYSTMARIFAEKGELKQALQMAEKSYQLNPSDSAAVEMLKKLGGSTKINPSLAQAHEISYLGDQFARRGDCLAAQAEYKAAFEINPKNGLVAVKAARCLWQLNQSQEAISWLKKATEADKKLVQAYVLLADYESQKYNYTNAIQALNKISQMTNSNHEVLKGYGLVEFRRNNFKEALAYLQRSFKIYENDVETLILLSKTHLALNDFKEASKFAIRSIEVDTTNNEAHVVYAKTLVELYGIDSGVNYLKELIKKYSYSVDFRIGLAELLRDAERYKQAQAIYKQIIEADAKNKKAYIGLGECYQAEGLFNLALKAYYTAAILDPSDVEGIVRTGLVYLEKENYSEAVKQFQRAQKVNPLFPKISYFIGKAYYENGDFNFALTAALEERKVNPNLADSYLLAAEIYTTTKQYQKCAEEYQKAIKLRPQGAVLYVKLARCYRQSGSADVAESMLNIAASQESGLPDIYKEQGAIFETKGDMRAAMAAYNKYLALSPNAPDRKEIENRILTIGNQQ